MALTIASLSDGRVCPWFLEKSEIPEKFVVVPEKVLEKYRTGKITDGLSLAKAALAANGDVGTAHPNVASAPADEAKVAVVAEPGDGPQLEPGALTAGGGPVVGVSRV